MSIAARARWNTPVLASDFVILGQHLGLTPYVQLGVGWLLWPPVVPELRLNDHSCVSWPWWLEIDARHNRHVLLLWCWLGAKVPASQAPENCTNDPASGDTVSFWLDPKVARGFDYPGQCHELWWGFGKTWRLITGSIYFTSSELASHSSQALLIRWHWRDDARGSVGHYSNICDIASCSGYRRT